MRRAIDTIFATVGLIAAGPVFALIAIAVKQGDGGPIIFSQTRVGRFGRPFRMLKFRTMVVDAESKGLPLTAGHDPRITTVGNWLRRTKLDELPQLWNVVRGDMSLVGPRPEVPRYVDHYSAVERQVLDVRPGITDPASLEYFAEADILATSANPEAAYVEQIMPRKLSINLEYLRRRSISSDARVVLATLWRMFSAPANHRATTGDANARRAA